MKNSVLAPGFNEVYHLAFDTGYSGHIYRVEIPITTQLKIAEARAKAVLREVKTACLKINPLSTRLYA